MVDNGLPAILGLSIKDLLRIMPPAGDSRRHIDSAVQWLCLAQDVNGDGGISAGFDLLKGSWLPSYPETTGYIIPTFFDYYRLSSDISFKERALRMAEWERGIQLECGAVMSGHLGVKRKIATIFDTGQVIFGWVRAYEEAGKEGFVLSIEKAADWLCDGQDKDGAWRKYPSEHVKNPLNVYNTRTAWALIKAYTVLKKERYLVCARKNIEWALTRQKENGWFDNNDFEYNDRPLTHTIGYAVEGILEAGIYFEAEDILKRAVDCCDALLLKQRKDGSFAGRYDSGWNSKAGWSCLTGDAQISVVFLKLYRRVKEKKYFDAARGINQFLKRAQEVSSGNKNINGGIKGSYPVFGAYEPYKYLSWAVKFFIDALMLEELSGAPLWKDR